MSFVLLSEMSCNLPQHLIDRIDLRTISMVYILDGVEYASLTPDDVEGYEAFYDSMREGKLPTTSLAQAADVVSVAEPILESGQDILYIGFSSSLSATYDVVSAALTELGEKYPDRTIISVDSLCASGGHGLMILYAAKLREQGLSIEEVARKVEEARPNIAHWFTVEDLGHLSRGGRLSKGAAIVGSALNIKPILHMDDEGKLVTVKKMRGRKKALHALVDEFMERKNEMTGELPVIIAHGDSEEEAREVADLIRSKSGISSIEVAYLDPVIGSHVGPGLMSVYFYGGNR